MVGRKSKPGPEAFDAESQPEKDLSDAALLLELIDSGSLRTDKPLFEGNSASQKRLGAEEEIELARRIQIWGDVDARNALVMANVGLVHMIVGQMLRPHLRYEDLLQEGTIGLIRATETFQPDRKIRFATYGVFWIRAKIQRFIQSHEKDNKPVTGAAIETEEGKKRQVRAQKISLDNSGPEGEDAFSLMEILPSEIQDPERVALTHEKAHAVRDILQNIVRELKNPHLQAIIDKRLLADEPESLEQLGQELHISRESCRLLETKMLKLAREQLVNWRS
jgi:RNA polymerase sigma factor (sigma-70 family)